MQRAQRTSQCNARGLQQSKHTYLILQKKKIDYDHDRNFVTYLLYNFNILSKPYYFVGIDMIDINVVLSLYRRWFKNEIDKHDWIENNINSIQTFFGQPTNEGWQCITRQHLWKMGQRTKFRFGVSMARSWRSRERMFVWSSIYHTKVRSWTLMLVTTTPISSKTISSDIVSIGNCPHFHHAIIRSSNNTFFSEKKTIRTIFVSLT